MQPELSILSVTRGFYPRMLESMVDLALLVGEPLCEVVLAADGPEAVDRLGYLARFARIVTVQSRGYIESVLDEAVAACRGKYVLRLDDDERVSKPMAWWLVRRRYLVDDHWQFARAYLWGDELTYLDQHPLWPDWQTRLSVAAKAGGRHAVHDGSPYGGGRPAPVAIEHHKYLLQSREEREALIRHYDSVQSGSGSAFRGFYVPEDGGLNPRPWLRGVPQHVDLALKNVAFPIEQHGDEIGPCLTWLLERGPLDRVLEIGTNHGGTASLWCETAGEVMSIDLPGGPYGSQDERSAAARNAMLRTSYPHFTGVLGDSHSDLALRQVDRWLKGAKLDLLFIDGDHTYEGVTRDFEAYRPFVRRGGVVLFHDIVDTITTRSMNVGVHQLWSQLEGEKREFSVHGEWGGLGALVV